MKLGMPAIPVLTFRGITLLAGGLAVLLFARLIGHSFVLPRRQWPMLLLSAFFNITLWFSLAGFGVTLTESGRAAIIAYTMPAWSVLFAKFLLGEPFTWRRALSLTLGMAAVAILLAGDLAALGRSPLGPALMAMAAASWALGTVIHKKVAWAAPTYVVLGWQVLIGGLPIYVAAPLVDAAAWQPVGLVPILALIYNIVVPFLFCYYAYLEVVRLFPVGVATIGTLFIPILGVFSGALVLGEAPGLPEFAALTLVVGALAVPVLTGARAVRPPVGPT
jgi:drug/metabolite transporter (DMT)-like permease